jgi:hypothetical protein
MLLVPLETPFMRRGALKWFVHFKLCLQDFLGKLKIKIEEIGACFHVVGKCSMIWTLWR